MDSKAYDHISATYFLLAEKRLRLQNDERLKALSGAVPLIGLGGQLNASSYTNPNTLGGSAGTAGGPPSTVTSNTSQCAGRRSPQPHPSTGAMSSVHGAVAPQIIQKQLTPPQMMNSTMEQYPPPESLSPPLGLGSTEKPPISYLAGGNQSTKLSMPPLSGRSGRYLLRRIYGL